MKISKSQDILYPILKPFSLLYAFIMKLRRDLLKKGIIKAYSSSVPTVSIGNISWGGTGKTPVVEHLADWALKKQLKTTILTRGYGSKPPYTPLAINTTHSPKEVGDEALMLADSLPHVNIVIDPNRSQAARHAIQNFTPDIFFLDDAFQHIYIDRQLNLLLLNYNDLENGWNKVIPAGTWREPASALEYADAYCIKTNRDDWETICTNFQNKLQDKQKPLFGFRLQAIGIVPLEGDSSLFPPEVLKNSPYTFITGIGNPYQAEASVTQFMGKPPAKTKYFPDHYSFTKQDAIEIVNYQMPVICTHKDAVKLKSYNIPNLWYLKTKLFFGASYGTDLSFDEWFEKWWNKQKKEANKDKTGLDFNKNKEYKGNRLTWGENIQTDVSIQSIPSSYEEEK